MKINISSSQIHLYFDINNQYFLTGGMLSGLYVMKQDIVFLLKKSPDDTIRVPFSSITLVNGVPPVSLSAVVTLLTAWLSSTATLNYARIQDGDGTDLADVDNLGANGKALNVVDKASFGSLSSIETYASSIDSKFASANTSLVNDDTDLPMGTIYTAAGSAVLEDIVGTVKNLSIQGVVSGGVTITVEATNDPNYVLWVDITKSAYDFVTGTTGNASYVDTSFLLDFDGINAFAYRIKVVTSDATNSVEMYRRLI